MGGDYPSEGIVQVYFNGEWGIVCDPGFDGNAALAVCRQLGYDTGSAFIGATRYLLSTSFTVVDVITKYTCCVPVYCSGTAVPLVLCG